MTQIFGHAGAKAAFAAALASGALHHAWLLAGPEGVGKATFARWAALRLLSSDLSADGVDERARTLFEAGTHPDFREVVRLPKDAAKPEQGLARSITIAQVRALQPMLATTPALSQRRVILIDTVDDLERGGANALLKNLEEPPAGAVFLLVTHAPGGLLATIRSRCRLLRFTALDRRDVAAVIRFARPDGEECEVAALVEAAEGAPGQALRYAGVDLALLDRTLAIIAGEGDRDNHHRGQLAKSLAGKAAQPRYEAFLDRAPRVAARLARDRSGEVLASALAAYAELREVAAAARGLSLDPQATVFEMGGILARLAEPR